MVVMVGGEGGAMVVVVGGEGGGDGGNKKYTLFEYTLAVSESREKTNINTISSIKP